ncbi:MAG: divalent-cation tolerance protein CutA [Pseudomonadota bacterium]
MQSVYKMLVSTCPDNHTAEELAHYLVANQLAACVNILPAIQSVYRWQDAVASDEEVMLLIKTHVERYDAIQQVFSEHHPYDVPELLCLPIEQGLPAYLEWIGESVREA